MNGYLLDFFSNSYTSLMPLNLLRSYYSIINNSDITDRRFFSPSQEILEGKRAQSMRG